MFPHCKNLEENLKHKHDKGSNRSAHILLNLLNQLGKRHKMRGLSSSLNLFRNEFNKFNNIKARVLDYIYHMTLRLLLNLDIWRKNVIIHYVRNAVLDVITFPENL